MRGAVEEWLAGWDANGAEWDFWVERNEAFRTAIAGLLHAETDDVAVTTSVSQGVSALVSALPLDGERNRIVISEYEFPTVGQIAHAQELRGAEVVHVQPDADGAILAERFAEAIDERTALVCCTTVSYRSGHRHDVAAIAAAAHEAGALVLADSYQACGAVELDVGALGADAVTGGTVKYLLGTAGLGFMWVRPELRRSLLPTQTGWFADEDIFAMSIDDYSPHASARRFDSGTPPVPALYAGVAGLDLLAATGVPAIEAHVRGLVDRLLDGLDELGATVATPRDPAAPRPARLHPLDRRRGAGRRPRRGADRHLDARREPAGRLPPLQRRGRRRPAPRRARPPPRAPGLTTLVLDRHRLPPPPCIACGDHPDQVANLHLPAREGRPVAVRLAAQPRLLAYPASPQARYASVRLLKAAHNAVRVFESFEDGLRNPLGLSGAPSTGLITRARGSS